MLTWLGYIDGIHGAPYMAAPWIRHWKWDTPKNIWFIVENPKSVHYQWIGFDGTIFTGPPHDLHGKIHGFRWRFSPENQSIIVRGWDLRNHQNGEFTHWQLRILTGIELLEPSETSRNCMELTMNNLRGNYLRFTPGWVQSTVFFCFSIWALFWLFAGFWS